MTAQFDPITGRYVYVDAWGHRLRIYFEEAGQGIPLVCLHTAGAHASQYRHIMSDPRVTDHFRVIAFDLPWHGKSTPPPGWHEQTYALSSDDYVAIIMAFIDTMSLDQPVVMGCSMGGRVVVRLAAEHGESLRAVIGLEASDHPTPWYDDSWLDSPEFARGDFCAALVSGLVAPGSPDETRWETLWHYYQGGSGVFRGDMHFFRTDSEYRDASSHIDTGQCAVHLLTGEYDYSCRAESTHETVERIPGATATTMQGLGHFPMSEDPEQFATYLLPLLDNITAGSS
jgi:pimeloyl-ACP methyl ester carboxylesterase